MPAQGTTTVKNLFMGQEEDDCEDEDDEDEEGEWMDLE